MQTFSSQHYKLLGYHYVEIQAGVAGYYWCFKALASTKRQGTILVSEAKYVDAGRVYFLHEDGSVENRFDEQIQIPETAN